MQSTVIAALSTFLAAVTLVWLLRPLAPRFGLVDLPGGRRRHAAPTPAIGGVAIFIAIAPLGLWLLPLTPQLQGLAVAALIILVAGIADDRGRLRWQTRLCAQVAAALALVVIGDISVEHVGETFGFPTRPLGPLSTPLTVIATVGIINAVNMSDGVDGLAGSLSLAALVMLAGAAIYAGNTSLAVGLGLTIGALCGFLVFNLRTPWNAGSRVFLGNAGSELLGLFIACAGFRLTQNEAHPVGVHLAPFLVAPVIIDCLTLMIRRMRMGVSPFVGDRNHLHHMLLDSGLTPTAVVVLIAGSNLAIGVLAAIALKAHVPAVFFSLTFLLLWGVYFYATRRRDVTVSRLAALFGGVQWMQRRGDEVVMEEVEAAATAATPDRDLRRRIADKSRTASVPGPVDPRTAAKAQDVNV